MPNMEVVRLEIGGHLEDIAKLFKKGAKLTLVVRHPGYPERDLVLTDDNFEGAIAALLRRRDASLPVPPSHGAEGMMEESVVERVARAILLASPTINPANPPCFPQDFSPRAALAYRNQASAAIAAHEAALAEAGLVIVSREAGEEMTRIYRAMVAAAEAELPKG